MTIRKPYNCYHLQMMREDTSLDQFTHGRVNATWQRLQCTTRLACLYRSGKNNKPQTCTFGSGSGSEDDSRSEDCYHLQMMREDTKLDTSTQNSTNDTWESLQCTLEVACAFPAGIFNKPKACKKGSESDDGTDSGNSDRFPSRPWKREKKALATGEQEEHELPPSMDYDVEARFLAKYLSLDWATRQAIGHQVSKMLME